jgi:hypothetical protein
MGYVHTCFGCNRSWDTRRLTSPYSAKKYTEECPHCGYTNSYVLSPFEDS